MKTLKLLLLLGCILFCQHSYANHIIGGETHYTCLGNNQYEVTFTLYRACGTINPPTSLSISVSAPNCGLTASNQTLTQGTVFGDEITPICNTATSNCGTGSLYGIRRYDYTGVITLASPCDNWVLSWTTCCWTASVTNGSTSNFYLETLINNSNNYCNNSAQFSSTPMPFVCANQPFIHRLNAYDIDGDFLIYEMADPKDNGPATSFQFNPGLSVAQPILTSPLQSLAFDSIQGTIEFTAAGSQVAVSANKVYEIRNGDTVGVTMRTMFYLIDQSFCPTHNLSQHTINVSSTASYDSLNQSYVACVCDTVDFIFHIGVPAGDTISYDALAGNIGTVFGPANVNINPFYPVSGQFDTIDLFVQINTCGMGPGNYSFGGGVVNDDCPVPSRLGFGTRLSLPVAELIEQEYTRCAGIAQQIQLETYSVGSGSFQWTQLAGISSSLSNSNIANPILFLPASSTASDSVVWELEYNDNGCISKDTLIVRFTASGLSLEAMASAAFLCNDNQADTIQFNAIVNGPVDTTLGVYNWSSIPSGRISELNTTTIPNPTGIIQPLPGDSTFYILQYNYGLCSATDTTAIFFQPGLIDLLPATATICPGDTVPLSATLTDTFTTTQTFCDNYILSSITYAPLSPSGPITNTGANTDETVGPAQPIGFDFDFFCQTYSQFRVASNGFLSFNLSDNSAHCCRGDFIPDTRAPNNFIAFVWDDLDPGSGGSINYFISGTAPNRILVIDFDNVSFWNSASTADGQIHLHEGTNIIEIHSNAIGMGFNMTQGIENATGTMGVAPPGKNSSSWSVTTPEAWRFTPNTYNHYPISYEWLPNQEISFDNIANPQVWPSSETTYTVSIEEGTCILEDSITIQMQTPLSLPVISCDSSETSLVFHWAAASSNATGWEVSIDSGQSYMYFPLQRDSLMLTGLAPETCVKIMVREVDSSGTCPYGPIASLVCCTSSPCNDIQGVVVVDQNSNCVADAGEVGIIGTMLEFQDSVSQNSYYTNVYNTAGAYNSSLSFGNYTISVLPPNPYWQVCTPSSSVLADTSCSSFNQNFVLQPQIQCPYLEVDLSVFALRETMSSYYTVSYCNNGTVAATNAMVTVDLDPYLTVLSTSIPIASQTGNQLTFNIGNLNVTECGSFTILVIVDAAAFNGQTHCSEAHIYPDSICIPGFWSGPILEATATCLNDTMNFSISNSGSAMAVARNYYIYEDDTLISQNTFQLGAGASQSIAQPADPGKTYRIIAQQAMGYPALLGDSTTTAFVENCNAASGNAISQGYGLQFSNGNSSPYIAVDCQENIAAYDPNLKKAQPFGYQTSHYISANTILDYTIKFQNTGNDTAVNVIILDTLDPRLDISTLQVRSSSHAMQWQIIQGNILEIKFNSIMLPDSATNPLTSQGYLKFRIHQKANNPAGTIINNSAAIYFDFQPPVQTNTTFHEIGENFIISVATQQVPPLESVLVRVFPNPFESSTQFVVEGADFEQLDLFVFDVNGRQIHQQSGTGNRVELLRSDLPAGLYFYQLMGDGQLLQNGKVVAQ